MSRESGERESNNNCCPEVTPPQISTWNQDLQISELIQIHLWDIPISEHIWHLSKQCLICEKHLYFIIRQIERKLLRFEILISSGTHTVLSDYLG